jgi:16S rRNA (cytosine967-C5)-methyltransferase
MTPAARAAAVIEILEKVLEEQRPADRVISDGLRQRRYMGSKDRHSVAEQAFRILRHRSRYDWWLKTARLPPNPRGWVVTDIAAHTPDMLSTVFSGGRFGPTPLADNEVRLAEAISLHSLSPSEMPRAVVLEIPEWAADPLEASLGEALETELAAMLRSAPVDLRVNTLLASRDEAAAGLAEEGLITTPTPHSPLGLRLTQRKPLTTVQAFRQGLIEVQDEGSQLLSAAVDAKPGMHVVDMCAGAGGKTLAIAAQMENRGRITALDIHEVRVERARDRLRRAKVQNTQCRVIDGTRDKWFKRHRDEFDRVMVDAPCSGTGTWRRNPDARWGRAGVDLDELTALQGQLLHRAASIVKPGGRLIYGTCSLLNCENEDRIDAFLEAHSDFRVLPIEEILNVEGCERFLKLTPARHGTDGFFGAVLARADG